MKSLKLGCQPLDDLLGGGLEQGIITKVFGEAGTGKTNLLLQASRECIRAGGTVAYIDTEGVSLERLRQICTKQEYPKILENMKVFSPTSFAEQETILSDVCTLKDVDCITVDTMNMFYRLELEGDRESGMRSFLRQMTQLQLTARKKNLYVVIAEQVYTDKNGEIKPFSHRETDHMVKTVIKLERKGIGERQATLMKHRFQPEGKTAIFRITHHGLE
ncbi:MAG: DNA repair and recombination protein RadB [Candidatus Thermoplasmatota archaeon]